MLRIVRLPHLMVAASLAASSAIAHAGGCRAQSPAHRVALVELYTSEGCSSCPPADRWLTNLTMPLTEKQVVALSLHVDYWDDIGWKDRFSDSRFSERQRWLNALAASRTIYTPEVFVDLREQRDWHDPNAFSRRVAAINQQPARANIAVRLANAGTGTVKLYVDFAVAHHSPSARGFVVLYEKKLSTEVKAGENRGARLEHDNVVRFWSEPVLIDASTGHARWEQTLALPSGWKHRDLGLAAFVEDTRSGNVLQAVATPACVWR